MHETQGLGEQVTLVGAAELLAGDRERRARHTARDQVDAGEGVAIHVGDVVFDDLPVIAAVAAQRLARVRVELDRGRVPEAGLLETERLAASASTDLHDRQLMHRSSRRRLHA